MIYAITKFVKEPNIFEITHGTLQLVEKYNYLTLNENKMPTGAISIDDNFVCEMKLTKSGRRYVKSVVKIDSDEAYNKMIEKIVQLYGSQTYSSTGTGHLVKNVSKVKTYDEGWYGGIFFSESSVNVFETAMKLSQNGIIPNVLMTGPPGYGKTSLPQAWGAENGYNVVRINCASVRDPEEWFGYREAKNGSTIWVNSEFTQAIETPKTIIILDEINRIEPHLHNTLFPILDDSRKTVIHGHEIACANDIMFFMTINRGYQFTGVFEMDQAITSRVDMVLPVNALPRDIEVSILENVYGINGLTASVIVKIMNNIRSLNESTSVECDASTRATKKIGKLVQAGMSVENAFRYSMATSLPADEAKAVMDEVFNEVGR